MGFNTKTTMIHKLSEAKLWMLLTQTKKPQIKASSKWEIPENISILFFYTNPFQLREMGSQPRIFSKKIYKHQED